MALAGLAVGQGGEVRESLSKVSQAEIWLMSWNSSLKGMAKGFQGESSAHGKVLWQEGSLGSPGGERRPARLEAEHSRRAALTELDRKPGARHAGPERMVTAHLSLGRTVLAGYCFPLLGIVSPFLTNTVWV